MLRQAIGALLFLASAPATPAQSFGFVLEGEWQPRSGAIRSVAFAPDGRWFAVVVEGHILTYTVDPEGGVPSLRGSFGGKEQILGLAISPDGNTFAVVDRTGGLAVLDATSLQVSAVQKEAHKRGARAVTFSSDGSYVVTGGEDGRLRVWTARGQPFAELSRGARHKGEISMVAALPSARGILSVGRDRQIILWDLDTQRALRPTQVDLEVLSAGLGGDGKTLVLGLQRLTGNRGRNTLVGPVAGLGSVDPNSRTVYTPPPTSEAGLAHSIRANDLIRLIDAESGLQVRDLLGEQQDLDAVAVSPDGRFIAAAGGGAYASVWDATTGDRLTNVPLQDPATTLAFSPDGKWLVIGTESSSLALLKLSGVHPAHRPGPAREILIFILSPGGLSDQRGAPVPRFATPSVRIQGKIKTAAALKSLLVAGREVTSLVPDETGDLRFNVWVPIKEPGTHDIEVIAENLEGAIARHSFRVERAAVPAIASSGKPGRRIALVVGISDYADSALDLEFARRDAKAMYDTLTNPALGPAAFDRRDVRLLVDSEATVANINTGLREFLRQARDEDSVLFYFAGHGAPDPNQLTDLYLLAHDTSPNNVAGTGLLMRHVREAIAEIPAKHVLILTDSCHGGGIAAAPGLRSVTANPIHDVFLQRLRHASGGLAILTASEAAQVSFENARWDGHGVFTHFLVKGLRGEADADRDGIVALGELVEYVREQVKRETNSRQIPAIGATSFDRDLPLAVHTESKQPERYPP